MDDFLELLLDAGSEFGASFEEMILEFRFGISRVWEASNGFTVKEGIIGRVP